MLCAVSSTLAGSIATKCRNISENNRKKWVKLKWKWRENHWSTSLFALITKLIRVFFVFPTNKTAISMCACAQLSMNKHKAMPMMETMAHAPEEATKNEVNIWNAELSSLSQSRRQRQLVFVFRSFFLLLSHIFLIININLLRRSLAAYFRRWSRLSDTSLCHVFVYTYLHGNRWVCMSCMLSSIKRQPAKQNRT